MAHTSGVKITSAALFLHKPPTDTATIVSSGPRGGVETRPTWLRFAPALKRAGPVFAAPPDTLLEHREALLGDLFEDVVARGEPAGSFENNAPSWEELEDILARRRVELGAPEEDLETGPPNPLALKRTFGQEGPVRVKLYRDTAAWCPYCQKVWIQLEEKRVPYVVEKINLGVYGDKPESFLKIAPNGTVPVMELDGKVVAESAEIAKVLEKEFTETTLLPQNDVDKAKAEALEALREKFSSAWTNFRKEPEDNKLRKQFYDALDDLNASLLESEGPYFLGKFFSLVDIDFAPFLERAVASMAYFMGLRIRGTGKWAGIERWFDAMESRPSYIATRTDYYTFNHCLPAQMQGKMTEEGKGSSTAIDGRDGKSWHLPLEPITATSLEPYSPGEDPPVDRLQAAAKLVGNHENVVKFALRAVGQPGDKPSRSPLADPTAVPGMKWMDAVDAAFRHVAHALLIGVEEKQSSERPLNLSGEGRGIDGTAPVYAAEYVRDRVGVPRELKYPAARQLRAHLNWLIDTLTP